MKNELSDLKDKTVYFSQPKESLRKYWIGVDGNNSFFVNKVGRTISVFKSLDREEILYLTPLKEVPIDEIEEADEYDRVDLIRALFGSRSIEVDA
jgi:hypothetical protein